MISKFPYFVYPMLKELRELPDTAETANRRRQLSELIAANVGDDEALIGLIGRKDADLRNFYPEDSRLSTEDTIDSFLAKFGGGGSPLLFDSPLLAEIQAPDYETAQQSALEELPEVPEANEDVFEEIRNDSEAPALSEYSVSSEYSENSDKSNSSEIAANSSTLPEYNLEKVKELVKKRDYQNALEIMEAIYLNNPKKSIYFADQIRYIKKMMLNDSKK